MKPGVNTFYDFFLRMNRRNFTYFHANRGKCSIIWMSSPLGLGFKSSAYIQYGEPMTSSRPTWWYSDYTKCLSICAVRTTFFGAFMIFCVVRRPRSSCSQWVDTLRCSYSTSPVSIEVGRGTGVWAKVTTQPEYSPVRDRCTVVATTTHITLLIYSPSGYLSKMVKSCISWYKHTVFSIYSIKCADYNEIWW